MSIFTVKQETPPLWQEFKIPFQRKFTSGQFLFYSRLNHPSVVIEEKYKNNGREEKIKIRWEEFKTKEGFDSYIEHSKYIPSGKHFIIYKEIAKAFEMVI